VREIFERYANGEVAESIASSLNAQSKCRRNGELFERYYIYKVLQNNRYMGEVTHHGVVYNNIYPPIVSDELWNRVNAIHEENKHAPSRKKDKYDFLLSGKIVCGVCGLHKHGVSGTSKTGAKHAYYSCRDKSGVERCACKPIRKEYLENLVIDATVGLLNNEETVARLAQMIFDAHQRETQDNTTLNLLKQQRNDAYRAGQNMLKAIEMGIINELTRTRFAELEAEIAQYDVQIEQEMQRCHTTLTIDDIRTFLTQHVFKDTSKTEIRKIIVNTFVRAVILYVDRVVIVYNFEQPKTHVTLSGKTVKKIEKEMADATTKQQCSTILTLRRPQARVGGATANGRQRGEALSLLVRFAFLDTQGAIIAPTCAVVWR